MATFGVFGYWLRLHGWPRPPLLLGLVLGPEAERHLWTSYQLYEWEFVLRPITSSLLVLLALILGWPAIKKLFKSRLRYEFNNQPNPPWVKPPGTVYIHTHSRSRYALPSQHAPGICVQPRATSTAARSSWSTKKKTRNHHRPMNQAVTSRSLRARSRSMRFAGCETFLSGSPAYSRAHIYWDF